MHSSRPWLAHAPWRRAAIYLILLTALLCALHFFLIAGLHRRTDPVFGRWNRLARGEINADILVVGSSRAHHHYNPEIISRIAGKSCYNLGAQGTFVHMQRPLLSLYLQRNTAPELIVLDVHSLEPRSEIFKPLQYVTILNDAGVYTELLRFDPLTRLDRYIPLFAVVRRELFDSALAGWLNVDSRRKPDDTNGFVPKERAWREKAWQASLEAFPDGIEEPVDPAEVLNLDAMVQNITAQGIPVVMVYSPVWVEYTRRLINREQIQSVFGDIAGKYNIPFWDYTDGGFSDNRNLFYDARHMNADGATAFSSNIAHRVDGFLDGGRNAF